MEKIKVLFWSDSCLRPTGFGRNSKEILFHLHRTGKYEIVEYCCGQVWSNDAEHRRKPWRSFGALPDNPMELQAIAPDEGTRRFMAYGAHCLDKIIFQERPDVVFCVQDIWGIDFAADKEWFDKVNCVLWTTLDSLPLHEKAIDIAPKVKNFWVWSSFAEKEMKRLGFPNVKTVHGAVSPTRFFALSEKRRVELKQINKIPLDSFVVGFVFRNQPRKSVPNLLAGFRLFRNNNPECKNSKLLLHCHWREGWDIRKLASEYKIPHQDILTTYICNQCRSYGVQEYLGEPIDCPHCKKEKSYTTTGAGNGVSEEQLNEVYNMMDVYCHPFTSGGQEIPICEAKFCELITLVTNYSSGEEMCGEGAFSLPLDWAEYREPDSLFIKATTYPSSISKQLTKVFKMSPAERAVWGKNAKKWALQNFSTSVIGQIVEKFIDECPKHSYPFIEPKYEINPMAQLNENIKDNEEWIIHLYDKILGRKVDKYDSGVRTWLMHLKRNVLTKNQAEQEFRRIAAQQKIEQNKKKLFDSIKEDKNKKILYVIPASERDVFLSTALFKSIKEQYPEHKLFVATNPQFISTLDGNPYVDRILTYYPEMDNLVFLEGNAQHDGFFDIAFLPHIHTQRSVNYIHGGMTKIAFGESIKY
jgi:glycosyltransferase involved in cell wall biosynthesis